MQDCFQPPGIRVFAGGQRVALGNQQRQQTQQQSLDLQLISQHPVPVHVLQLPQTSQRPVIAGAPRRQPEGQGQPPALQWQQIPPVAQVAGPPQQLHLKDNVLIFHCLSGKLPQSVEHTGGKHKDVPCPGCHRLQPHLHQTAPLFDKNQLHAVLPMQSHLGEVLGNGAGVDIKGKPPVAVALILLQSCRIRHFNHPPMLVLYHNWIVPCKILLKIRGIV